MAPSGQDIDQVLEKPGTFPFRVKILKKKRAEVVVCHNGHLYFLLELSKRPGRACSLRWSFVRATVVTLG